MPAKTDCYCSRCNVEYATDLFESCPVCLSPPVETARRPWSRTEFLFRNFGDSSRAIVRMHADQSIVNKRLTLVGAIVFTILVIVIGLNASQDVRGEEARRVALLAYGCTAAVATVIVGLVALTMKNLRPVEILSDGSLRIPKAMAVSRSITGNLINAAVNAGQDASERGFLKIASSDWLPFVDAMGKDKSLSLVNQVVPLMFVQFFHQVDSQIVEVGWALRALAIKRGEG